MHIDELIQELRDAGVPLKEAVRQARAMLKRQEAIRAENNANYNKARRTRKQLVPYNGWGNGR